MNNKYFWIGQIEVIYKELGIRRTPILSNFEMFENIFDFQDTFYKQLTYLVSFLYSIRLNGYTEN